MSRLLPSPLFSTLNGDCNQGEHRVSLTAVVKILIKLAGQPCFFLSVSSSVSRTRSEALRSARRIPAVRHPIRYAAWVAIAVDKTKLDPCSISQPVHFVPGWIYVMNVGAARGMLLRLNEK
jgi:hypothetical protein